MLTEKHPIITEKGSYPNISAPGSNLASSTTDNKPASPDKLADFCAKCIGAQGTREEQRAIQEPVGMGLCVLGILGGAGCCVGSFFPIGALAKHALFWTGVGSLSVGNLGLGLVVWPNAQVSGDSYPSNY